MGGLLVFALVVGLACVPWTYYIITFGLPLWASFIGSALFFASGGEKDGLIKTIPTVVLGILCAVSVMKGYGLLPGPGLVPLSIAVGIAAFLIVILSQVGALAFVPGSFGSFATTFAVMTAFPKLSMTQQCINTFLAMLAGIIISYLIQVVNGIVSAKLLPSAAE